MVVKHTLAHPTYPANQARNLLKKNHLIECWSNRDFRSLPAYELDGLKYTHFRSTERASHSETERDLASYFFLVTFGRPPGDLFYASKYLEYMSAYQTNL